MKIFISMGMKDKSTSQVKQEMQKVFEVIKEKLPEAELVDSVIENADNEIAAKGDSIGIWFLGESLKMLSTADLVFFVNDSHINFRGCGIERSVAESYGKYCVDIKIN